MSTSTIADDQQVVMFELDEGCYALDIAAVREIMRLPVITPIPAGGGE